MTDPVTINASDAFRDNHLNITVKVRRDWRFRLGFWLISLGCRVLRCGLNVDEE